MLTHSGSPCPLLSPLHTPAGRLEAAPAIPADMPPRKQGPHSFLWLPAGRWEAAHAMRNRVLEFVREAAGAATLLDIRRHASATL